MMVYAIILYYARWQNKNKKNTVVQNEKQTQIQKKQELSYRQQIACQPKKTDWEAWLTSFG